MRERLTGNPNFPSFVEISKAADTLAENFPDLIDKREKGGFSYTTPYKVQELRGKIQQNNGVSNGSYLEINLNLPVLPSSLNKPKIYIVDTPENNAITIGRIKYDEEINDFHFIPARFHTGYPALKDMAYAMRASLKLESLMNDINSNLDTTDTLESQMFMLHIAREGPLMRLEGGFFNVHRLNIPYTIVHSQHEEVDDPGNPFGRIAKVCDINFEGLVPESIKTIAIADNTASGMQHVEVLRKVVEHIRKANGNSRENPRQFLIFSPLLTHYGILTVSMFAASLGINVVFVTSSTILKCIPPERYYSPVSNNGKLFVNPQHVLVNEQALGELSGKICSRCNWTASFSAVNAAISSSKNELAKYGWTNDGLIKQCKFLTINKMRELSIEPQNYISYAALEEANYFGVSDKLTKELK